MEADGFWDLFREYEEAGGGYIHTVVQPDMGRLGVVDLDVDTAHMACEQWESVKFFFPVIHIIVTLLMGKCNCISGVLC